MNFLKKNHTNLWPITINSNLNPNKKIKNNEYKCASCQKYAYVLNVRPLTGPLSVQVVISVQELIIPYNFASFDIHKFISLSIM